MNDPFFSTVSDCLRRPRRPVSAWIPIAFIVAVLGAAGFASSCVEDTRSVAERHGTVLRSVAL